MLQYRVLIILVLFFHVSLAQIQQCSTPSQFNITFSSFGISVPASYSSTATYLPNVACSWLVRSVQPNFFIYYLVDNLRIRSSDLLVLPPSVCSNTSLQFTFNSYEATAETALQVANGFSLTVRRAAFAVPSTVKNIFMVQTIANAPRVSWSASSCIESSNLPILYYRVVLRSGSTVVQSVQTSATVLDLPAVQARVPYNVDVYAVSTIGQSRISTVSFAATSPECSLTMDKGNNVLTYPESGRYSSEYYCRWILQGPSSDEYLTIIVTKLDTYADDKLTIVTPGSTIASLQRYESTSYSVDLTKKYYVHTSDPVSIFFEPLPTSLGGNGISISYTYTKRTLPSALPMRIFSSSDSISIYFDNWDETNNGGFKSSQVNATILVKEGFDNNPIFSRFVEGVSKSLQLSNLKKLTKYQLWTVQSNPIGNSSVTFVNTATDLSNDSPFYFSFGVMQPMWVLSSILVVFHLVLSGIGCGAIYALKTQTPQRRAFLVLSFLSMLANVLTSFIGAYNIYAYVFISVIFYGVSEVVLLICLGATCLNATIRTILLIPYFVVFLFVCGVHAALITLLSLYQVIAYWQIIYMVGLALWIIINLFKIPLLFVITCNVQKEGKTSIEQPEKIFNFDLAEYDEPEFKKPVQTWTSKNLKHVINSRGFGYLIKQLTANDITVGKHLLTSNKLELLTFYNPYHAQSFKALIADVVKYQQGNWPFPHKWGLSAVKEWIQRHHFSINPASVDELALHGSVLALLTDANLFELFHVQDPLERMVILDAIKNLSITTAANLHPLRSASSQLQKELGLCYPLDVYQILEKKQLAYPELLKRSKSTWINGSLIIIALPENILHLIGAPKNKEKALIDAFVQMKQHWFAREETRIV